MWSRGLLFSGTLLYSSLSIADMCEASVLSLEPITSVNTYDVFATSTYPLRQQFNVRTAISEGCDVIVVLDLENERAALTNAHRAEMRFDWYSTQGQIQSNKWILQLDSDNTDAIVEFRFVGGQWLEAGVYKNRLRASLFQANSSMEMDQLTLNVDAAVLPSARIQFYGLSQRHYNLDLGSLKSNKIIDYDPRLWVESTAPYALSVDSLYDGKLRHQSQNPKWDLAYQMLIANEAISFDGTQRRWSRSHSTDGTPLSIQIIVGDTKRKAGGKYSDTVHIYIAPSLSLAPQ
ncbi:hypothetical protein [Enterovibrio nigricans]|uniref:Uncharacterized protein n=1 Tax=Enterovibrio nigricans DSM 22720 TaxID=1121868 RepID=A0A1T4UFN5_9GAMM|nr:hypothetical protein [Enterovibrio nigricans]PKF51078.1 hypothetical protein AT251_06630 [Enterovibrio nigricans]SKA51575.1 hypothetical protein SAMN02745132_01642 [Enterovibrio nigricans DSM 22720]